MPDEQISFDEFTQRKQLSLRMKKAFGTHVTARLGRLGFLTAQEWGQNYNLFLTADRRRH